MEVCVSENNTVVTTKKVKSIPASPLRSAYQTKNFAMTRTDINVDEFYRREKRKNNGLIEKLYNSIKNLTGLGTGTNKVEQVIKDYKDKKVSSKDVNSVMHKYQTSQENSAQLLGDAVSVSAAGLTFYTLNKSSKYINAALGVNKPFVDHLNDSLKKLTNDTQAEPETRKFYKKLAKTLEKTIGTLKSNKKMLVFSAVAAALTGGFSKYFTLKFNRAGSDEFKVDTKIYGQKNRRNAYQKNLAKASKKELNKERRKTNFKNFASGTINGLMMPLLGLGGLIGGGLYIIGNSLNRYFIANKTDKNKSLSGYVNNLTNDIGTTGLVTAALAIPIVKKGNYIKKFNQNIEKVTRKLADADLTPPDFKTVTAYKELENLLLNSPNIKSIINSTDIPIPEQIAKLTKENIFAVKFKQISGDGELARALKDKCPPTRTIEEAQKYIDKALGKKYEVYKLLGVGTVAETYLAKSKDGEVCIKILKEGISKEKILADKEKFVNFIKNAADKTSDEKDFLIRNIDDLAEGILKEVDLKNEMDAAMNLAKNTNVANVVKPIEVKNNVYVMQKAKGISLASFIDMNDLYLRKEAWEKLGGREAQESIKKIEQEMEALKQRMPGFDNIKFDKKDTDFLLNEYRKVFIEQFHKINKNGKTIHGDIHPGNIFIDPEVLRTRKGKLFTLIDTGNVINMNVEQSMHALNLTKYVKQGNVTDIVEYVLKGAKLPAGMSEKEAAEKVSAELKKCFFDDKTKLQAMNTDNVLTLAENIMQKYKIIPNNTQLNLNKSRISAGESLTSLRAAIMQFDAIDILNKKTNAGKIAKTTETGLKLLAEQRLYAAMIAKQEKENLKQLSPALRMKHKHNPNAPKTNSEDYLTYKLKQLMLGKDFNVEN